MDFGTFQTPGELIQELLKDRGWSQRTLAVILQNSEATITRLMRGQQPLSAAFAVVLEDILGVPADTFLALQSKCELAAARKQIQPDPQRATRVRLHGELPIAEMIKRGWLGARDVRDTASVEAALLRFFGAKDIEDVAFLLDAAATAAPPERATPAQSAWLRRVRQIAGGVSVAPYSPQAVRAALPRLQALLVSREAVAAVPGLLAACGIRLAIVEALAATGIDGACLWLNDRAPVIGLSLRTDRIDAFWLMLRHQIERVLDQDGGATGLLAIDGEDAPARAATRDFCLPSHRLDAFIAQKVPFISEADLVEFAAAQRVHPGIVAGLIQDRTGGYNGRHSRFKAHLVAVRALLCDAAVADGWGKIAPADTRPRAPLEPAPRREAVLAN